MLLPNVLIIDATDRLGWLAGRVLADLGADVIKLEPPGTDRSRADWRAFNVNKRIVELDPQTAADRARARWHAGAGERAASLRLGRRAGRHRRARGAVSPRGDRPRRSRRRVGPG